MDQAKALQLEDERTAQKRYTEKAFAKADKALSFGPIAPIDTVYTQLDQRRRQQQPWRKAESAGSEGVLYGRVALASPHELLKNRNDFYVGDRHLNLDGVEVFSWATPVACTYFRGGDHHEWCDDVAVIRAFSHQNGQIKDFYDDVLVPDAPSRPFPERGLAIPARAPGQTKPLPLPVPKPVTTGPTTPAPVAPATLPTATFQVSGTSNARPASSVIPEIRFAPASGNSNSQPETRVEPTIRAEELLRARMAAPRTKALAPVLSTLQPDQYQLVTVAAMESIIVEGQPGTGKTIIAAHRAAWMVNEEMAMWTPEKALDGNVLMVGPTSGYANHVRGVVDKLTGGTNRVTITSLPSLMGQIIGQKGEPKGPTSRTWMDVDTQLGQLTRLAIRRFRDWRGFAPSAKDTYELLRANGKGTGAPISKEPEWTQFLAGLPPFEQAVGLRAHYPLLAFISWELGPNPSLKGIEHIIVDEAQDVTPLEWMLLTAINEADAWTLLGDMNQRRCDHTLGTWHQVCEILALPYDDPEIHRLERGYRSTKPILEYANRLLPAKDRLITAFQTEGPEPVVIAANNLKLDAAVIAEIGRLTETYANGTVAVISTEPVKIWNALRVADWHSPVGKPETWQLDGAEVTVLTPDAARGLEFDAVIVVEPSDFPKNLGRQGPLYTSLTRPNRELVVVHKKALPEALRVRTLANRTNRVPPCLLQRY